MTAQRNRLSSNIIANAAGRIWAFLSIFIFVPVYVKLLGIESYGVITFYSVLLTFLTFADAGFAATMNREFAKVEPYQGYKQNLLVTFEKIYVGMSLLIATGSILFAPKIVTAFLDAKDIPFDDLVRYVRLMGLTIACYFFASLYQGGLMGLQRQVAANVLNISYNAAKAGLVIIPLLFAPSLEVYFYWQIVTIIIYVIVSRIYITRVLGGVKKAKTDFSIIKPIWRYTVGMTLLAIIYAANTQIDKLTISNLLPLTDLGLYFMAASVAQASLMLATPIGMAVFPELSRLVSIGDTEKVKHNFGKFSYIVAMIVAVIVSVIFIYAYDYIAIWQSDSSIAAYITPSTRILLIGFFFMGIQLMPYYLALANGYTKINVILGLCSIVFLVPSMSLFIGNYGFIGAAYPWLIINSSATLILAIVTIRKFAKGEFTNWIVRNTLLPTIVTALLSTALYLLFARFSQGFWTLIYGSVTAVVALYVNIKIFAYFYPETKQNRFYKRLP